MKEIYIVRWLPWSWKSTFAKSITDNICEADEYFIENWVYNFDSTKLKLSHEYCQNKCLDFMKKWVSKIAVSNTFVQWREMDYYKDIANQYEYMIYYIILENRQKTKNMYSVSDKSINNMRNKFEISL